MTKRRWIAVAAAYSVMMCGVQIMKAVERYQTPPTGLWMTRSARWYDESIAAGLFVIVAGACLRYLYRTHGEGTPAKSLWRNRPELRLVLYSLSFLLFLQFPLGLVAAVRAYNYDNSFNQSVIGLIPFDAWVSPTFAALLISYDRRRVTRETWEQSGACMKCGYDLTGNVSGICPECGSSVLAVADAEEPMEPHK